MFDSGFDQSDLIFSDLTESLSLIPWAEQNYTKWLGSDFIRWVRALEGVANHGEAGIYASANGTP